MREQIIVKMKFGSHLYGTDTPESDLDFKGVFMPTKEQVLLGKIPKAYSSNTKTDNESKNSKHDIDSEIYSLHYFLQLACEGQTVALDMLHAPDNMLIKRSLLWYEIIKNREKFYTRNLQAFIGYARKQAAKYGIKGTRLNDAKRVIDYLKNYPGNLKLNTIWDSLPLGEHLHYIEDSPDGRRQYQVCGKKLQDTISIQFALGIISKFYEAYGKRAILAARNEGIDWKAISHAFRAAYQTKQILEEGTITFPLSQAPFLLKLKLGQIDYQSQAAPMLDELMDEIEILSAKSQLPLKVDQKYWNNFLIRVVENELFAN